MNRTRLIVVLWIGYVFFTFQISGTVFNWSAGKTADFLESEEGKAQVLEAVYEKSYERHYSEESYSRHYSEEIYEDQDQYDLDEGGWVESVDLGSYNDVMGSYALAPFFLTFLVFCAMIGAGSWLHFKADEKGLLVSRSQLAYMKAAKANKSH
ncbi:MAG: hypothetical protein JRI49_07075 [Deltaproteobacteria bacterium]|nr:hypothetical protein [Deltaproteobacteria bacterium]